MSSTDSSGTQTDRGGEHGGRTQKVLGADTPGASSAYTRQVASVRLILVSAEASAVPNSLRQSGVIAVLAALLAAAGCGESGSAGGLPLASPTPVPASVQPVPAQGLRTITYGGVSVQVLIDQPAGPVRDVLLLFHAPAPAQRSSAGQRRLSAAEPRDGGRRARGRGRAPVGEA
jgi:hypothetical protein